MAFDAFILIDGISGECTDEKHTGWIEVIRYGIDIKQTVSKTASSAGGASAERADFSPLMIRKLLDKSSPKLALACADGTHINRNVVELCRAGTEKQVFMRYTLKNCMISRVQTISGSDTGNEFPAETIHFVYGNIEFCYIMQTRRGGGPAGNVAAAWDLLRNCSV